MRNAYLIFALAAAAFGQTTTAYAIDTIAGTGPASYPGDGQAAIGVILFRPNGIVVDSKGTVYFCDAYFNRVFKVSNGVLTTAAGNGVHGYGGDGGPASQAEISGPGGMAVDQAGNLYFADFDNGRIRMVTPTGVISTVAGEGGATFGGDGGPAISASLSGPTDVKFDAAGNMYIADYNNYRIRKVTPAGIISTIGGTGQPGYSGDGGPATSAKFKPFGLAIDSSGNIYLADDASFVVREISATTGNISTVAGTGVTGYSGDGGQAIEAQLSSPVSLAIDQKSNLFISDSIDGRIRVVTANGVISTYAGGGSFAVNGGDGTPANRANLIMPRGIALDSAADLFIAESEGRRVREVTAGSYLISRVAGIDVTNLGIGDGGNPQEASFYNPLGTAVDSQGNIFVADELDFRIRKIASGIITTVAGSGIPGESGNGAAAVAAELNNPSSPIVGANGDLYFDGGFQVRAILPNGNVSLVAGTGSEGYNGDNIPATTANLFESGGQIAVDAAGNIYLADKVNQRIRMVNTSGVITTIAGTGTSGYTPDGGPAALASIASPQGIAVDSKGNVYFSDTGNNLVRKIAANGVLSTVAGTGATSFSGDGGLATKAGIPSPTNLMVDPAGNLYVCTSTRIRRIDTTGIVATIVGTGTAGYSGDGAAAINARINGPSGPSMDSSGNIYFGDSANQVVRMLTPANFFADGVVNAASLEPGSVAPGEIITIFGTSIGPNQIALPNIVSGRFASTIGGTQVLFNGTAAPMVFASSGQISAIVPYEIAGQFQVEVQILNQGKPTNKVTIPVAATSPALFTSNSSGAGQGAILNQDLSVNSVSNPAAAGSLVVLYGTGEGQTNPTGQDGLLASSTDPFPVAPFSASVGGQPAHVFYFGAVPGEVAGLFQANIQLPAGITGSAVPVTVTVGGKTSQSGVVLAIH